VLRRLLSVLAAPSDLYADFVEDLQLGRESVVTWLSYTMVASLNFLLIVTKCGLLQSPLIVGLILMLISLINCVFFFKSRKVYQLFHCTNPLASPNIHKLPLGSQRPAIDMPKEVYELHVWEPSPLSTRIFSYFSPLQVAIILTADGGNVPNFIFHICTGFLAMVVISLLVFFFMGRQRDRGIISNEAYEEFNRFALRKLAVPKLDCSVQVDSTSVGTTDTSVSVIAPTPYAPDNGRSEPAYSTISAIPIPAPSPTAKSEEPHRRRSKANPFQSQRYL